jgi:hypothetical protein
MNTPTKRFRHAIGSVDTDSEGDDEIDASAILTSGGVGIEYQAFAKRLKTHHSKGYPTHDITMDVAAVVNSPCAKENPGEEKRKNQVQIS